MKAPKFDKDKADDLLSEYDDQQLTAEDLLEARDKLRNAQPPPMPVGFVVGSNHYYRLSEQVEVPIGNHKHEHKNGEPAFSVYSVPTFEDPTMGPEEVHVYYDRNSLNARLKRIGG